MSALFASGHIIDLILVLVVLEAVGLGLWYRWTGRGIALGALAGNLGSGAALLLAVRAALVGTWWGLVALPLLAGLLAHLLDLRSRWRH